MANRQESDILFKKEIKYTPAIGDWIHYKPSKYPPKRPSYIPYKISKVTNKELAKALDIHTMFTQLFLNSLQNSLKLNTDLFTTSVEQMFYGDFLSTMDNPLLYAKLIVPDIGEILLYLDFSLINSIINFSLGCPNKVTPPRTLTEVEESIISSVFKNNLDNLLMCWQNIFKTPELQIISSPAASREPSINNNEVITLFTSIVSLGGAAPAKIVFAYQNNILQTIIKLLKIKEELRPLNLERIPSGILDSIVIPVNVEIGETKITANELVNIELNDIIQLNAKLGDSWTVNISKDTQIPAQPGIKDNKYAVRFVSQKHVFPRSDVKTTNMDVAGQDMLHRVGQSEQINEGEIPLEEDGKEGYNAADENIFSEDETPHR